MTCQYDSKVIKRFWSKVDKSGECWVWTGARDTKNYGVLNIKARLYSAHRASYEINVERIPHGLCVLHKCDNPPCVNPGHLFLGTHQENMADMASKGRSGQKGERAFNAKLTDKIVAELFELAADGQLTHEQLARQFRVTRSVITNVLNVKAWAHIHSKKRVKKRGNSKLRTGNVSGATGVGWAKREQKFRARLSYNGKELHLGYFDTFSDAVRARRKAEEKYGFRVQ